MNVFDSEIGRLILVGISFLLILGCAEIWHALVNPPTEWTRKFIHVASGLIIACFHWIFIHNWPVIVLCLALACAMIISRKYEWFRLIYGIKRASWGDYYFLLAIALLFPISHQKPILYLIAVLNLTISDALAALFGKAQMGKSLRGSIMFLISSFLIVYVGMSLNHFSGPHLFFIALLASFSGMIIEALCTEGLDNLLVPLAVYSILAFFSG